MKSALGFVFCLALSLGAFLFVLPAPACAEEPTQEEQDVAGCYVIFQMANSCGAKDEALEVLESRETARKTFYNLLAQMLGKEMNHDADNPLVAEEANNIIGTMQQDLMGGGCTPENVQRLMKQHGKFCSRVASNPGAYLPQTGPADAGSEGDQGEMAPQDEE
jgi:hypothetical protein